MDLRQYKQGFERLGIVAFLVVAAIFVVIHLGVGEPYAPPSPDSEAGLALADAITTRCGGDAGEAYYLLCREETRSAHKWRYYRERIVPSGTAWLLVAAAVVAIGFAGRRAWAWIAKAFRQE